MKLIVVFRKRISAKPRRPGGEHSHEEDWGRRGGYLQQHYKDVKTTKDGDYELFIRARSEQGHATATAGLVLALSSLYHHRSTQ